MRTVDEAVAEVLAAQTASGRPLGIVLAGHNGSGKSTLWSTRLAPVLKIPLINADRMMMSVLPEPHDGFLPEWAQTIRDRDLSWMRVAQLGVDAFVVQAMAVGVPFAFETVFSDWRPQSDGSVASKIDRIRDMQRAGYFVLLLFVGLADANLSIGRVATRIANGGHAVDPNKLTDRFPRTQTAIRAALPMTDASILVDNSRAQEAAFTVCRIQLGEREIYDLRATSQSVPAEISIWLQHVAPR